MVERIDRIEKKLDDLATSLARRFDAVGAEFNAVTGALVEQRQYTEFAFGRLEGKIETLEAKMDARFDRVDRALSLFIRSPGTRKRSPRKR